MNILVTGARAPISADIIRVLHSDGHTVYLADSWALPVGRFSPYVERYFRLPAPKVDFQAFGREIESLVRQCAIDRIIPTSEEVFWLANIESIKKWLFAPSFEVLLSLHDKFRFAQVMTQLGYGARHNLLLRSVNDAASIIDTGTSCDYVVKPVFSRFATKTLISPSSDEIRRLDYRQAWLAQSRVYGEEICIYAIASKGNTLLHLAYRPRYRAGLGASIYFEPVIDAKLIEFSTRVIEALNLSGQVCFDVILTDNGLVALECNPRGTSGVHLAAQHPHAFASALVGCPLDFPENQGDRYQAMMLGIPFILYHAAHWVCDKNVRADARRAIEAMKASHVPLWGGLLSSAEILSKAIRHRCSPLTVSTIDIEWNGY